MVIIDNYNTHGKLIISKLLGKENGGGTVFFRKKDCILYGWAPNLLELMAVLQSPFLPSFRKMMKGLPLPAPRVMLSLSCNRHYRHIRSPADPIKFHLSWFNYR